ncbi:MAG: efflux RND transporter permease subunit [Bacteroides sp.]|nr:efflux RND transporter permease subunit [Ruminococcus flavefaciens]MCM1555746.1 efflux RND transporter permease subunit [Bacteroides sp.]
MRLDRFIQRPVLSTVISIIIVILGLIGLVSLPVEQYPDIAPPTVMVTATYTGADAQTITNSVITPLEDAINGVENMDYMVSKATNDGSAQISIYFRQGTDPDMAAVNVQNRVSSATSLLPAEVTRAGVTTRKRQTSTLLMVAFYSENDAYDETFIENYLRINILPVLLRVNGVGDARAFGNHDYSMRIWLRPDDMNRNKLVPADITAALAAQNIEAAPGKLGENSQQAFQYTMKYKGRLKEISEYENIIIATSPSGEKLTLKDVADIELGALNSTVITLVNGYPGASIALYQLPGSNATQVIEDCQAVLEDAARDFPSGMKYVFVQNSNDFLYESIHKVIRTLFETFILVFLVVYIFLQDFRSTLIPAIAVPVSLVGTLFVLNAIGFSLNLLTLFALVLAIAIVVDDAIVVVEAVHAKLDQNYRSARQATIDAMGEIAGAIISITLVMASVFVPVAFIQGTAGVFFRQFGLTLAISIFISAINALTLSPALCALFLKPHKEEPGHKTSFAHRFHMAFNVFFSHTTNRYRKGVDFFIRKPILSMGVVLVGICTFFFLLRTTPTGLIPNEDNGVVMIGMDFPPATTLYQSNKVMARADSLLAGIPEIYSRNLITGFGFISGNGSCYGSFILKLKPWDERKGKDQDLEGVIAKISQVLNAQVPEAKIMIFSPPMIPGFSASNGFEFSIQDKTGGSINDLYDVTQAFLAELNKRPEIRYAATSFRPDFPQYMVDIDDDKAAKAGISPSEILSAMQGFFGGQYISNFNTFGKLYRVMLQAAPRYTLNEESLNNAYVRCNGQMLPLSQFVSIRRVYGSENINRFNLFTSIGVNGQNNVGFSSGEAIQAIKEVAAQTLPTGYGFEFSGLTRNEQQSGNTMGIVIVLCILFVYLLLCIQYESYILPLAVILSLPFGLAGTFIFARMMGLSNNIYLQISFIMLIGLLCKNAILIVQFALQRRESGMSIWEAASAGAVARFRPILMTSLALIIGLIPLMVATGAGSNGNRTIGAGAVGGMLIGMIFQLFIVPVLFAIFEKLQERFKPVLPPQATAAA